MGRHYKRKLGARLYKDYTEESVDNALARIIDDGWSMRKAADYYKIPYGTLNNRYHGRHIRKNGGQTVFGENEEKSMIACASLCGEWGFPLNITDLRHLGKNLLDSQGRNIRIFNENMPGKDWVYSLIQRHKTEVTQRLAANIKRTRADVSRDTIIEYFRNLRVTLSDIPPNNIFNYDETNLQDDPGRKIMLFKRGTKYPTRICNFTKSATSVMMCGSASGVLLPPYIIYRAEKMWTQWAEGGPKGEPCCSDRCCMMGARYNRTRHGWIDAQTFTDWFVTSFLPHARKLEGRKVLLGDNLSSHFTDEVIRLCEENNISFVCLPKNSTHLTQPLDVGFFRPFKGAWRSVLENWKRSHPMLGSIDKKDFPQLLKKTLEEMDNKSTANEQGKAIKRDLIASFRTTGLVPLDAEQVLKKLPGENPINENDIQNVLVDYLKEQRHATLPTRRNKKRTKLSVEAGKSVTAQEDDSSSDSDIEQPLTQDDDDDGDLIDILEENEEEETYLEVDKNNLREGLFVLVKVLGGKRKKTGYRYVAIVQTIEDDQNIELMGLKSCGNERKQFKVVEDDKFTVNFEDIIAVLPNPIEDNKNKNQVLYNFSKPVDISEL